MKPQRKESNLSLVQFVDMLVNEGFVGWDFFSLVAYYIPDYEYFANGMVDRRFIVYYKSSLKRLVSDLKMREFNFIGNN